MLGYLVESIIDEEEEGSVKSYSEHRAKIELKP